MKRNFYLFPSFGFLTDLQQFPILVICCGRTINISNSHSGKEPATALSCIRATRMLFLRKWMKQRQAFDRPSPVVRTNMALTRRLFRLTMIFSCLLFRRIFDQTKRKSETV